MLVQCMTYWLLFWKCLTFIRAVNTAETLTPRKNTDYCYMPVTLVPIIKLWVAIYTTDSLWHKLLLFIQGILLRLICHYNHKWICKLLMTEVYREGSLGCCISPLPKFLFRKIKQLPFCKLLGTLPALYTKQKEMAWGELDKTRPDQTISDSHF